MSAAQSILESFMSARTKLSSNATFGWNLYSLSYDVYGLVIGANIEVSVSSVMCYKLSLKSVPPLLFKYEYFSFCVLCVNTIRKIFLFSRQRRKSISSVN